EGYLKQHFNTPNAYMGLVAALQQRETLLLGVLERFRDVLSEGYRQTTYPQANLILTNILQLTQGKKTDRFAQTFDALATVAVSSGAASCGCACPAAAPNASKPARTTDFTIFILLDLPRRGPIEHRWPPHDLRGLIGTLVRCLKR
ncbi:MAG: hypothetical protein B7Z42_10605, partial [Brevundimonas sp. 12-68-7]